MDDRLRTRAEEFKQGAPEPSSPFERWMIDSNATLQAKVEPIYREWDYKSQRKEKLRGFARDLRLYLGIIAAVMGIAALLLK